jgi:equilibrative nucleoside transporter 1/2/3
MPPRLFFCFVLVNAAAQSAAGSYLQTAVVAVASLFGPAAMQAVMAGQAVIAVAVSGVQVVSAIASTWGKARSSASDSSPEEGSAFFFFTLSTLFVFASVIAHNWLINSSTYKAVAAPLEQHAIKLLPSSMDSSPESLLPRGKSEAGDDWRQAVRIAKANITYEIAVAYIFVITLVCTFSRGMKQRPHHILPFPRRPSSPPSPPPFYL